MQQGDLGVHGMGISIGKLALYCAAGGIAPHRVLPVALDVGTNNESLLTSPDYVGLQNKRLQGDEYYDLVIDTSKFGVDEAVKMIQRASEQLNS